jgi:hypothetical protein
MKRMNRIWTPVWTASLLVMGAVLPAAASRDARGLEPRLVPVPVGRTPQVQVWTDAGDGATVLPGERMDVMFRTNRDAFVVVVDVDTRGRARLLFPESRFDDGFVRGRRTVALPSRGYRLQVTGPAGTERIIAFASDEPIADMWRELLEEDLYADEDLRGRDWDDVAWSGSIGIHTRNADVVVAGGSRGDLQPQLVRVPEDECAITRDETWFRVGRPYKGRRW